MQKNLPDFIKMGEKLGSERKSRPPFFSQFFRNAGRWGKQRGWRTRVGLGKGVSLDKGVCLDEEVRLDKEG